MRSRLPFLVFLAFGCAPPPATPSSAPVSRPEATPDLPSCKGCNLVFVSFDALQAAHVGHLGYSRDTTPAIDAIAGKAFRFANATSVASWTVPASMTWFTGVYPSEHRVTNKFAVFAPPVRKPADLRELAPHLTTLADILKANGYDTAGFTGNAGVSGDFGFNQGFDTYFHEKNRFGGFDRSVPEALKWLAAHKDRKFFLFLHGYDCHGQYTPEDGLDYRFVDKDYDRKFAGTEQEQEALREEGLDKGRVALRDADVRFWRAVYDEKIRRADERFRAFLAEFERLGLADNTLFVLTSDHGTELHEHGRLDHGFTLYQEQVRVPLVIRLPRQKAGRTVTDRVSSIDLMPTILDLLAADVPADTRKRLRGTSLVSAMNGEPARRDVISETDYRQYTYKRSLTQPDGWKLIVTLETKKRELYHLPDDPSETRNRAADEPKRADALEAALYDHFNRIGCDLRERRWEVGLNPVYPSQAK